MQLGRDHDKQLQRINRLATTLGQLRTITGAPDLFGDAIRPHLDQAAALRNAATVGVDQAAARARRLPEQIATGEVTLDQAVTHLAGIAAWTPPTPGVDCAAAALAGQAARHHEAAAITAARAVAPQLYAALVPFAQGAITAGNKAARVVTDIPALANIVRGGQQHHGGLHLHPRKTKEHQDAWRNAAAQAQLLTLIYSTSAGLAALEGRNVNPWAVTFGANVDARQYEFVQRNVDEPYRIAVYVELGWMPGYYPPADAEPTRKQTKAAGKVGAAIRAMAGAR